MIITFHSLEEKCVSQAFAKWRKAKLGELGTKKHIVPSEQEMEENPYSRSAKLMSFVFN
jgi:16S rRNA (cytosine1402-N4)-methyltransferase